MKSVIEYIWQFTKWTYKSTVRKLCTMIVLKLILDSAWSITKWAYTLAFTVLRENPFTVFRENPQPEVDHQTKIRDAIRTLLELTNIPNTLNDQPNESSFLTSPDPIISWTSTRNGHVQRSSIQAEGAARALLTIHTTQLDETSQEHSRSEGPIQSRMREPANRPRSIWNLDKHLRNVQNDPHYEDPNDQQYFTTIDRENSSFMKFYRANKADQRMLSRDMITARNVHSDNLETIRRVYNGGTQNIEDIDLMYPSPLTTQQKLTIKDRVRNWSENRKRTHDEAYPDNSVSSNNKRRR